VAPDADDRLAVQFLARHGSLREIDVKVLAHLDPALIVKVMKAPSAAAAACPAPELPGNWQL
jgi:hypothetical protein